MITLYSGTPGSGKSLHVAEKIFTRLFIGVTVIGNFDFDEDCVKHKKSHYIKIDNWDLTPEVLQDFAIKNGKKGRHGNIEEGQFLLVIDECQMLFNSRDFNSKDRMKWCTFFAQHRKYGFNVVLIAQFDRMIDRQIRALIEYEFIHRKVSNFGWQGKILNFFMGGGMFVAVEMWYPMKERIGAEFYRYKKKYAKCYDSYKLFTLDANAPTRIGGADPEVEDGGKGAPPPKASGSAPLNEVDNLNIGVSN